MHHETNLPFVSVIMPVRNERAYLEKCLQSLWAGDYPSSSMEIIIVDGESSDGTRDLLAALTHKHPNLVVLTNPKRIVPPALNLAIKAARGEFIVRVDAHSIYEPDYVRTCVELLQTSGAANVGGPQRAVGTDYVSWAIAIATTSRFGAGDAKFRYSDHEAWVETVYLGAWRKSTLEKLGGFDERFTVNQDYELNHRIIKSGGKILLSPRIRCSYYVRPSLSKLAKQYFRYGMWKVHTLNEHPDSLRWRQLVPPLFVASLLISTLHALLTGSAGLVGLILVAYLACCLAASAIQCTTHGVRYLPILPVVFLTLHMSWGAGFIAGLFRFLRRKPTSAAQSAPQR